MFTSPSSSIGSSVSAPPLSGGFPPVAPVGPGSGVSSGDGREPSQGRPPAGPTPAGLGAGASATGADAAPSLKLVVARAQQGMAYTYTLVDEVTGRVVAQIPHQSAQDAAASPDYAAGGVIDTRA